MTKQITDFLANLSSTDSQVKVWLNPDNFDEFSVCPLPVPGHVCIGNLADLSFADSLDRYEAVEAFLIKCCDAELRRGSFEYKGRTVRFNYHKLLWAYSEYLLNGDMAEFLEEKAADYQSAFALEMAEEFVAFRVPYIVQAERAELEAV